MTKGASILNGLSLNMGALISFQPERGMPGECGSPGSQKGSPTQDWTEEVGEA